jgi:hypothetical protein
MNEIKWYKILKGPKVLAQKISQTLLRPFVKGRYNCQQHALTAWSNV